MEKKRPGAEKHINPLFRRETADIEDTAGDGVGVRLRWLHGAEDSMGGGVRANEKNFWA